MVQKAPLNCINLSIHRKTAYKKVYGLVMKLWTFLRDLSLIICKYPILKGMYLAEMPTFYYPFTLTSNAINIVYGWITK